jgi:hypothetical protein
MAKSIIAARGAINVITQRVSAQALGYTTYCAAVIKLPNGNRGILIAEAGASASGISASLLSAIENQVQMAVIGSASTVPGQGTWHMNDAEQQALRIWQEGYPTAVLKAVKATRAICDSCTYFLQQRQLIVNGDEAVAP